MSRYTASSAATSSSTCNVLYSFCNRHVHTDRTALRSVCARAYTPLFTHDRWRDGRREREREGRMIAGGRGDDKKGKEAADALVCFLSLLSRRNECRCVRAVRTCVWARVCVSYARTTSEHYLRYACDYVLSRFRLTRKRLLCGSGRFESGIAVSRARAFNNAPLYDLYPVCFRPRYRSI